MKLTRSAIDIIRFDLGVLMALLLLEMGKSDFYESNGMNFRDDGLST